MSAYSRADQALDALEGRADAWSKRVDLRSMIENAASPMRLNRNAPDDVRESFRKRMIEQIDAIVRQAWGEGALEGRYGPPKRDELIDALKRIARGRAENGRPLQTEIARQIAREALVAAGIDW